MTKTSLLSNPMQNQLDILDKHNQFASPRTDSLQLYHYSEVKRDNTVSYWHPVCKKLRETFQTINVFLIILLSSQENHRR